MATLHQLQQGLFAAKDAGDNERQKKISDAIRQHPTFQKQSQQKLAKGFTALSGDERKAQVHKHTARSLGIHEDDLDSERGMGGLGRAQFKALPNPEDKLNFLDKTYGRENINVANIGGEEHFLYRDEAETGGKWRRVDEEGVSLADFTSDIVGLAPEIGGAVVGGVKGAALGTAVAPGVGTAVGAVLGAAGGGFAGGVAKDVAARATAGQDIQLGETVARKASEIPMNIGIDVATLGAGRFVGKPLMKVVGKTPAAQGIMDSMQSLKGKYGLALEETADVTKGLKARETAARRAGETGGALTRAKQSNIDEIGRATRVVDGVEAPTTAASAIERMQNRVRGNYEADIAKAERLGDDIKEAVKTRSEQTQKALQYQLDNEVAGIRLPREFDPEVSAERFRSAMLTQKDWVSQASREKFEKGLGDMEQFTVPASELQAKLGNTVDALAGIVSDDALVSGLSASKVTQLGRSVSQLKEMADSGKVIPFRSLHNLKKSLDDASGYGAAQPSDNQLAARRAATKVRELIDKSLKGAGQRGKAYKKANEFFQERMTPFRTKSIAPVLASDVAPGTFKETGEKLARKVVSDPEHVRQILKNAGGTKATVKKEMADMYMDSIGTSFDFNPRIASQLFPEDVVKSLNRIKSLKNRLKIPARKISEGDVRAMINGMSKKARMEAEKVLKQQMEASKRADAVVKSNKLIAKIASGKEPMPSNPRNFADDVIKENPETIKDFVKALDGDPDALVGLRAGVVENFRDAIKFGGDTAQRTSTKAGEVPLWKAGDVEKILSGKDGAKYRAAMGDDWAKDWIDLDRALKGSEITGEPLKEQVRGVFTTGTGLLIVAAGVPKWAYGRAMNAMGGSKLMRPFLRNVEQDPAMMQKLIPYMLGTSGGIEALLEEGKNDPEFAEFVDQLLAESQQESQ
jgi:hypothetical protein